MWAITATVTRHHREFRKPVGTVNLEPRQWTSAHQVPTFYLHENVQGIINAEHAARVAREVIDPLNLFEDDDVHITAVEV